MAKQEQIQEQFLSCYVCFDTFKEPKTLTCLHRFCERCLHNYIIGLTTTVTRKRGFPCPVCREFITAPDPKRPPSDWAAQFKTDFHLKDLIKYVESGAELSQSSKISKLGHLCPLHKDKDCDLYCVDCSRAICHLCAGINHRGCNQVVTLTEAAEDRRANLEVELKNVSKKLEAETKRQSICESYMTQLEHQKVTVEAEIKKWGQNVRDLVAWEEEQLLEKLKRKFDVLQEKVSLTITKFENSSLEVKNQMKHLFSSVTSASDFDLMTDNSMFEVVKELQKLSSSSIEDFRGFQKGLSKTKVSFEKKNISSVCLGEVVCKTEQKDNASDQVPVCVGALVAGSGTNPGIPKTDIVLMQNARSRLSTAEKIHKPVPSSSAVESTRDKPPSLTSKSTDLPRSPHCRTRSINDAEQRVTNKPKLPKKPQNVPETVTVLRTINTRFKEDALDPQLRDLIVVGLGNTIIVTDWANQCVKVFQARRERDSRLTLGGKPWGITQLSDVLAAVSLPQRKQICVIKTRPSVTVQNSFISAKNYSGLATLNSSMLVASGGFDPPSVDIINLYGEVLKSFTTDKQGTPMFQYPSYVSINPAMLILVSDKKLGAVMVVSHTGESNVWSEGAQSLQKPSGVTCDSSGHIFVVESRGLLAFSSDGQTGRALVKPGDGILDDPRGVALDSEGLVYVTSHDDEIKVLRLV